MQTIEHSSNEVRGYVFVWAKKEGKEGKEKEKEKEKIEREEGENFRKVWKQLAIRVMKRGKRGKEGRREKRKNKSRQLTRGVSNPGSFVNKINQIKRIVFNIKHTCKTRQCNKT